MSAQSSPAAAKIIGAVDLPSNLAARVDDYLRSNQLPGPSLALGNGRRYLVCAVARAELAAADLRERGLIVHPGLAAHDAIAAPPLVLLAAAVRAVSDPQRLRPNQAA